MLFKGLESKIFYTLNQMQPDSPFLTELNRTADRHQVEYRMIIGNTSLLQPSASPIAGVWKQLATSLGQRGKSLFAYLAIFDGAPNDLAVRVDSAQGIPGGFVIQKEMATDHLSYFKDEAVLRELENMI